MEETCPPSARNRANPRREIENRERAASFRQRVVVDGLFPPVARLPPPVFQRPPVCGLKPLCHCATQCCNEANPRRIGPRGSPADSPTRQRSTSSPTVRTTLRYFEECAVLRGHSRRDRENKRAEQQEAASLRCSKPSTRTQIQCPAR